MLMMDSGEAGLLTGVVAPRAEEEELSLSLGAVILLLQLMVAVTVMGKTPRRESVTLKLVLFLLNT